MDTAINLPVSAETIRWAAERVLDMHARQPEADRVTGRCAQCHRDGSCDLLDWARRTVAVGTTPPSLLAGRHIA
jgi:hypothetical protein